MIIYLEGLQKILSTWRKFRERLRDKFYPCDALHNFVPFVQFKKRGKHPWMSVTFSKVAVISLQL